MGRLAGWLAPLLLSALPLQAAEAPAAASGEVLTLEEMTVTARRRPEKAQEVPLPLSVLGGDALAADDSDTVQSWQQRLPSTTVTILNPRNAAIGIRGLGTNPASDGLENSAGIFLDGIYLGRPGMFVGEFNDLDQVELLRGPQGTLFGHNTTAGAFNITTARPGFTPQAGGELTYGSHGLWQAKAMASGPLDGSGDSGKVGEGEAAGRLSAFSTRREGILSGGDGRRFNSQDRQGARGQILLLPTDSLTLRLIADYAKSDETCCVSVLASKGPNGVGGYDQRLALVGAPPAVVDPYAFTSGINSRQQLRTRQAGLTLQADQDLDGVTLTSLSGYRSWAFNPWNDFDGTGLSAMTQNGANTKDSQLSQELRLASPGGGRVEWVAGLYYFRQQLRDRLTITYGRDAGNLAANISRSLLDLSNALDHVSAIEDDDVSTNSYAVFGQGSVHLDDRWSLAAGLRETYERKTSAAVGYGTGGAMPAPGLAALYAVRLRAAAAPAYGNRSSTIGSALSGQVVPSYQITEGMLAYGLYSRGFKSGGLNVSPPLAGQSWVIRPEKADNLELGLKTAALDRRLVWNLDAFWTLVSNYQTTRNNYVTNTLFLANVGALRTQGLETEASLLVRPGLTLAAAGSFNDALYRSYRDGPCAAELANAAQPGCTADLTGHRAVVAPRWNGSLSAEYSHALADRLDGYLLAEYTYKSGYASALDLSKYSWVSGHGIANLRLGTRLDGQAVDLSLWAKNLFDAHYFTTKYPGMIPGGDYVGTLGDPLTLGVTLRVGF